MHTLIYLYPAVIAVTGVHLYKRDTPSMQKFYNRMTFSCATRIFFVYSLLMLMLGFNFWYLCLFGADRPFWIATALCGVTFSFRTVERLFRLLQTRGGLSLVFADMVACAVIPEIWPVSACLFILTVGSFFYPSKKLMDRLASAEYFSKLAFSSDSHDAPIIKDYYSR